MVRLQLDRGLERAHGASRIAQVQQGRAEARLRVQRFSVGRDGTAKMRGGFVQLALAAKLSTEIEVGVGELGVELHGATKRRLRLVGQALTQIDVAKVVVGRRELRIERNGLGDQSARVVEAPCLQR